MTGRLNSIFLALLVFCAPALAVEDGQQFRDWTARCEPSDTGQQNCLIYQTLVDEDNDRPVLQISVGYPPTGGRPAAMLIVPLGVALEPGMEIRIDENPPLRLAFNHCNRMGCVAAFPMEPNLIATFKAGSDAQVALFDLGGQRINLKVSLRGFTAGFDKLIP